MSALPLRADMLSLGIYVCLVPCADILHTDPMRPQPRSFIELITQTQPHCSCPRVGTSSLKLSL
jgi:hypothetical protein